MRPTLSLVRREFSAYFISPVAYVVLAVFLAVTGYLFYLSLEQLTARGPKGIAYPMQLLVNDIAFWLIFLVIPPLLTMRLFAEERSSGTLEMLLTAPLRDWQIVLSKFVACYLFYILLWLPTLIYLPVLLDWQWGQTIDFEPWPTTYVIAMASGLAVVGLIAVVALVRRLAERDWTVVIMALLVLASAVGLIAALVTPLRDQVAWVWGEGPRFDPWPVVSTYLGLALAGAMFLALGLLISSLVRSQMIAAFLAIFAGLVFIMAGVWRPDIDVSGTGYQVLYYFTVPLHFERNFSRGLVDTRNLIFYGTVALLCLFLTVRSLESRRWR